MICPRCGNRFTPEEEWKVICSREDWGCADEVDLYDTESMKLWRGLFLIVNSKAYEDHLIDWADSKGADMLLDLIWKHKDKNTKIQWMLKKSKEVV